MNHYHGAVQVSGRVGAGAVNDMEPYYPLKEGEEAHWEVTTNDVIARSHDIHVMGHIAVTFFQVVERILFLYAKTNKGIGYVQVSHVCFACTMSWLYYPEAGGIVFSVYYPSPQGMNEVLGPIYYVFAQHPDPKWKGTLENISCIKFHDGCVFVFCQNMLRQIASFVSPT